MEYLENFRLIILNEIKKRNWTRKDLAERINIDSTLVNAMLRGERRFNEDQVIAISGALQMEPHQLFSMETLIPESRSKEMMKKMQEFNENFQLVEEIESIACGNLSNISEQSIVGYKVFERSFLKGMIKPFLSRATGDSMFPTISDNDLLLFNRDPNKLQMPDPNSIYLVDLTPEEETSNLTIKRVELSKENWTLTIFPDNRQYAIEKYKMNQKRSILDYMIGVAVWMGKVL